jgi:poly(A) polymerase
MEPARHLSPAGWMTDGPTRKVLAALTRDGPPARFVGGVVRDWIFGRPATDIDIATPLTPDEVLRRLTAAGIRAIGTGIEHGTVTAIADHRAFEITTLRRDVETDGRHATVAFTDDWAEDAKRRDFTMNALYADADGTIYDPVGGLADLDRGLVRFIGDPAERIAEDYLRVLRFFRFTAHHGRAEPLAGDLAACANAVSKLATLSAERVWMELKKLLSAPDPLRALARMDTLGVLPAVLPERAFAVSVIAKLRKAEGALPISPLRRLAALIDSATVAPLAERLKLSHAERDELIATLNVAERIDDALSLPWPFLRKHGAERVIDGALVVAAHGHANALSLIPVAEAWTNPLFPIGGADVLALGLKPGPEVGALLSAVEGWWETGGCAAGRDECLARLKSLL